MCCAPSETQLLLRDEWAADELEDLNDLCDWLLEPQDATPSPERALAATFPRVASDAPAQLPPPLAPAAVALQPAEAPLVSPFSAASLQTPVEPPPQARRTRPRLSSAASAPAGTASQALSWVLAMGKLAESQGVAAAHPLACPWEAAALHSRPPSPQSAQHAADLLAPRPTHSGRSLDHNSSGSVAAENGSPALCTAAQRNDSLDLLDLLGADLPSLPLPPIQLASGSAPAAAAPYRGIGAYGTQRSAPLPQLPACGGDYERLSAARALSVGQQSSAARMQRAASATIGHKRLCTWDEHPTEAAECGLAPRRSLTAPIPPASWQQAQQLSAPLPTAWQSPPAQHLSAPLPPTWQAQRQPSPEDSFEAQRQRLRSLLAQLHQVRVALQQEAAAAPPRQLAHAAAAPLPQLQHQLAPMAAPATGALHQPALQAGHLSWPAAASWCEPSPIFN